MKKRKDKHSAELSALRKQADSDTRKDDIPETSSWDDPQRGRFYRPIKQPIHIRLDSDVLAWFKARGRGYQSRINEVLRDFMDRHRE